MKSLEPLLDALLDLQHDLGKYLTLPIAWLPEDCPESELRQAVLKALQETRTGPSGNRSAQEIWSSFVTTHSTEAKAHAVFDRIQQAVEQALAWEGQINDNKPIQRTAVLQDFRAVAQVITTIIREMQGDGETQSSTDR
ncbi:MAG: hypothetical protein CMH54_12060 [Myxococcales bacterium]|nr:hypothetical protein [Myxococcales bacterium]|tara:strand:- start:1356 stop:1772 length:417 start_codon:yes stop_codon:yes gene_type:complete